MHSRIYYFVQVGVSQEGRSHLRVVRTLKLVSISRQKAPNKVLMLLRERQICTQHQVFPELGEIYGLSQVNHHGFVVFFIDCADDALSILYFKANFG